MISTVTTRGDKRPRLVQAATEVFAEKGYVSTRVADIAEAQLVERVDRINGLLPVVVADSFRVRQIKDGIALGRRADTRRLGGDQGMEVDGVEQEGLDDLPLNQWTANTQQRLVREHHGSFGNRVDIARETHRRQVIEERFLEERLPVILGEDDAGFVTAMKTDQHGKGSR